MSSNKNSALVLSFSLALMSCLWQPIFSTSLPPSASPQQLYHQVWGLVRSKYFDSHFGGKDWSSWEHKYDGKLATTEQAQEAISSMLADLGDPYTRYLPPDETKREKELMKDSQMVGIGIVLQQSKDKEHLFVADTLEGSPAMQAGITPGDELLSVDGESISKALPDQCGQKIAGKENTVVNLLIKGANGEKNLTLERKHIVLHPVSLKELESNIGYIRLSSFLYGDATAEFQQGLLKMADKDGLIIDLRHNPGGQTFNALEIADMLLDGGVIVRTVDRKGKASEVAQGHPLTKQPIVVLVDQDSASASEILAAALKDHDRAALVGTRTYGKGLVQEIQPLPGGAALHLTIAQFTSPNGNPINHVGVAPEVEVTAPADQLKAAMDILKNKIANNNSKAHRVLESSEARKRDLAQGT